METESSESAIQVPVKPKPKKKAKPAKLKPKKAKAKPATKRRTHKNGAARKPSVVLRACRMDIRLTAAEREKLTRKAAAMRRTVTSIVAELIEKMK
jgi:hypothetical protein